MKRTDRITVPSLPWKTEEDAQAESIRDWQEAKESGLAKARHIGPKQAPNPKTKHP